MGRLGSADVLSALIGWQGGKGGEMGSIPATLCGQNYLSDYLEISHKYTVVMGYVKLEIVIESYCISKDPSGETVSH